MTPITLLVNDIQTMMGCQFIFSVPIKHTALLSVPESPLLGSNLLVWVDAQPECALVAPLLSQLRPLARRMFLKILQPRQRWKTREIGKVSVKLNRSQYVFIIHLSVDACLQLLQAYFNIMLKKFGVQGVKVQEIVSLDDEILAFLP